MLGKARFAGDFFIDFFIYKIVIFMGECAVNLGRFF